jgi:lipopolysaccharide export system protein LptA
MKRRTFLAAVAPLIAAVSPAAAQSPLGTSGAEPNRSNGGRARLAGAPAPSSPETAPAPVATGGTEVKKTKGPTEITSREAMLDNRINLATFSGEVDVRDPEYNLTCDKLTVYLKKTKGKIEPKAAGPRPIGVEEEQPAAKPVAEGKGDGGGGGGIDKAIAEGNVRIVQDKVDANGKKQRYFGKARRAVFDTDKKTCILYGWPEISQSVDGNLGKRVVAQQEGTIITLDQAGSIKVEGPQKTTLSDLSAFEQNPGAR